MISLKVKISLTRFISLLQSRSSVNEFDEKPPLSTSTPIKQEEKKKQVQIVAMSPKLSGREPDGSQPPSPLRRPSPSLSPSQSPSLAPVKSHIPISKDRIKTHTEKYQRTDDVPKVDSLNYNILV